LLLFALITGFSLQAHHQHRWGSGTRFFWWGAERLDSDPLNKHSQLGTPKPCATDEPTCDAWDPEYIWVEPGVLQRVLVLSAVPAFLIEIPLLLASSKLGISQIPVFFVSLPMLIFAWFYFLGWRIDRLRYRRQLR
jgi:hypothetical protein